MKIRVNNTSSYRNFTINYLNNFSFNNKKNNRGVDWVSNIKMNDFYNNSWWVIKHHSFENTCSKIKIGYFKRLENLGPSKRKRCIIKKEVRVNEKIVHYYPDTLIFYFSNDLFIDYKNVPLWVIKLSEKRTSVNPNFYLHTVCFNFNNLN